MLLTDDLPATTGQPLSEQSLSGTGSNSSWEEHAANLNQQDVDDLQDNIVDLKTPTDHAWEK